MGGIETIKAIRAFDKNVKIVVFSSFTQLGAKKTFEALAAGANDFAPKPKSEVGISGSVEKIREELVPKLQQFLPSFQIPSQVRESIRVKSSATELIRLKPEIICIGSSTGGPQILKSIFKDGCLI